VSSRYIMEGRSEGARLRAKTSALLIRHHLHWLGLASGQSFADFGCATGEVLRQAARFTSPRLLVGIDASEDRLLQSRKAAIQEGAGEIRHVLAVVGPDASVPLADSTLDHAWTRFFLEYLPDPLSAVREMARVVRPGGRVTLADLDGNCIWHYPTTAEFDSHLAEIMSDLATNGFDPHIGRKLPALAEAAGLVDIRVAVEPYHRIVGRPDAATLDHWRAKIDGIRSNYLNRLFPEKVDKAPFFDSFVEFIASEDTMTWSNLYLVQGTKPE
jgi:ubiquinone/menaquinone biosynthesis C-methylase UbiE